MAEGKKAAGKKPAALKEITFLKSPTGHFNLAYSKGQKAKVGKNGLDLKQAQDLIDLGFAE